MMPLADLRVRDDRRSVRQVALRRMAGWRMVETANQAAVSDRSMNERRALGAALAGRVEDVVVHMQQLTTESGVGLDPAVEEMFADAASVATVAFARWLSGDKASAVRDLGVSVQEAFAELVGHGGAALNELTKRCLRWRDSLVAVLLDESAQRRTSTPATSDAMLMTLRGFDVTLVRLCEAFETQRQLTLAEVVRQRDQLEHIAGHDPLTGLLNRAGVVAGCRSAAPAGERLFVDVIVFDLDQFRNVNDSLGYAIGDAVLRDVARRVCDAAADAAVVGRVGADEFVIVTARRAPAECDQIVRRLLEQIRDRFGPYGPAGASVMLTASAGIAVGDVRAIEALLAGAELATHQAKLLGRDCAQTFARQMTATARDRLTLETDLRLAIVRDEFFVVFQPIIDLHTMRMTGVEALLRWHHPRWGEIGPNEFVPVLEQTHLITDVGAWVLQHACVHGTIWNTGRTRLTVAVNVSAHQLDDDGFVEMVIDTLAATGMAASNLVLEITETAIMRDIAKSTRYLSALRDLGVRISIDDFGVGYSSLDHLRALPVDTLKIDGSFVQRITSPQGPAMIRMIVQLAESLSIDTVAEGIENVDQLTRVQREGCDSGQGFFLGHPVAPEAIHTLLVSSP